MAISGYGGTANAGDLLELACSVTGGNPTPSVAWYRGTDVNPVSTDASYCLLLAPEDDQTTVSCQATNDVGSAAEEITLNVKCKLGLDF